MNFNRKKLDSITLVLLFALTIFSLMAFTTYRSYVIPVVEIKPLPIKIIPVKIVRE